jgi:hypothetical protein
MQVTAVHQRRVTEIGIGRVDGVVDGPRVDAIRPHEGVLTWNANRVDERLARVAVRALAERTRARAVALATASREVSCLPGDELRVDDGFHVRVRTGQKAFSPPHSTLPIGAAHAALQVIYETDVRTASGRAELEADLVEVKAVERTLSFDAR